MEMRDWDFRLEIFTAKPPRKTREDGDFGFLVLNLGALGVLAVKEEWVRKC